ncbi:hypothetical protein ACFY3G_33465 [Streptomyces phaeochromogenes]|uniref:hypothetical protein n=1 Tax=Streptomyces phaeochromogenes TaxID=1923 RepID=UPI00369D4D78
MGTTRVVATADVLHTQGEHVHFLARYKQAHYLLVVKNNQPSLFTALRSLPWSRATARHAARRTIYAITDLPSTQASPQRFGELARPHWGIENRRHRARHDLRRGRRPLLAYSVMCSAGYGRTCSAPEVCDGWMHCYKVHR